MLKSEDPNIEALSRAVLREAHSDADQVLAEAKEKSDASRARAKEDAASLRAEIMAGANREVQRIQGEMISSAQMKARTLQLEQREKLLDEVFETARQRLSTVQQGRDYEQIARRLLAEAVSQLGVKQVQVRTDPATRKFLTDEVLAAVSKQTGVALQFGKPLEHGLGVIVETPDGHRRYDNTLEARLYRMRDTMRSSIYHLLMGEPL